MSISKHTNTKLDVYTSFDDMDLNEEILRGVYSLGFEKPSSIQQKAIVPVIQGKDIIAQAQSGTGKTATFSIGLLHRIDPKKNTPQAIVVADTRELAQQIKKVISMLAQHTEIKIKTCIGGIRSKVQYSKSNPIRDHVIVGTPGRIYDYLSKGIINTDDMRIFVIDEADKMLSNEFLEQIEYLLKYIPKKTQIGLFSATMPDSMLELTNDLMNNPVKILVNREELTLDGIKQYFILLNKEEYKLDVIYDLYNTIAVTQCVIYCNSKKKVGELSDKLIYNKFVVSYIHGDMNQEERNAVMDEFRSGKSRILIATDIVSRGIDVQQVSLVINYDLPRDVETYIHRIGRSGRFGRKGVGINLVTYSDIDQKNNIEKHYNTQIEQFPEKFEEIFM
jgi:translation initiation factor 4A